MPVVGPHSDVLLEVDGKSHFGFQLRIRDENCGKAQVPSLDVITLHISMNEGGIDGGDACKYYKDSTTSLHPEVAVHLFTESVQQSDGSGAGILKLLQWFDWINFSVICTRWYFLQRIA